MSVQAIAWAIDAQTGSPETKVLLLTLSNYADQNGQCFPGIELLAKQTEMSASTVKRHMSRLIELGFVSRKSRGDSAGGRGPNLYTLSMTDRLRGHSDPKELGVKSGGLRGQMEGPLGSLVTPDTKEEPKELNTSQQAAKSEEKDEPPRLDVQRLCSHLADNVRANGSKVTVTQQWRDEARRMLDLDKRSEDEAHRIIDWVDHDSFWRANILSMPKLRAQYDKLRLKSASEQTREEPDVSWMR